MRGLGVRFPLVRNSTTEYELIEEYVEYIEQELKHMLLVEPGESMMDILYGVGLKSLVLFENFTPSLESEIISRINAQQTKYMPFISIQEISISAESEELEENHALFIAIDYYVPSLELKSRFTLRV